MKLIGIYCLVPWLYCIQLFAQPQNYTLEQVIIEGNKRTKPTIIRRELAYKEGDLVPAAAADSLMKWERNKIFNTNLFVTVDVKLIRHDSNATADIHIKVHEMWYTIPQPIFEQADRNLNELIFIYGLDVSRLNYGIRLLQRNCRGRNETLKFTFQAGYVNNYEVSYDIPYINKKQTIGISPVVSYSDGRKLMAYTQNHLLKEFMLPDTSKVRFAYRAGLSIRYRPHYFTNHNFEMYYNYGHISDSLARHVNPDYYLQQRNTVRYFSSKYTFTYDTRDRKQFAHKGLYLNIELEQLGFTNIDSIHLTRLFVTHNRYFELGKRFLYAYKIRTKLSAPVIQPYAESRAMGDRNKEDFVRGYEIFVTEGQHYFLNRNSLRYRVFSTILDFKKIIPIRQFRVVPVDTYITLFADWGYVARNDVYAPMYGNYFLANRLIGSMGAALNIVSYYNTVVRLECSFTDYNFQKQILGNDNLDPTYQKRSVFNFSILTDI
ncbi:MAG: BamA/TamA family outer membrane protein [Cytophagales bacterium]|nr:BamA/TamA family outer membrane protein [Cytophagales bacterium]